MNWRLEVGEVKKAFAKVPEQRGCAALPEAQVERLTKLAMAEIRRKRAGVLLRGDILARTHDGEEYILEFARKRVELVAVREDAKPHWQRWAERGEMFSKALTVSAAAQPGEAVAVRQLVAVKSASTITDDGLEQSKSSVPAPAVKNSTEVSGSVPMHFSDDDLVNGLVNALIAEVGNVATWQEIRKDVDIHCYYFPQKFTRRISANSADELIAKARPQLDTETDYELRNGLTEWVMVTLFSAGKNIREIRELSDRIAHRGEELEEEHYLNGLRAAVTAGKALVQS